MICPAPIFLTDFAGLPLETCGAGDPLYAEDKTNEIANQPQAPHETSAAVRAPRRGLWQEWLRSLLLFCSLASVYVGCAYLCILAHPDGGRVPIPSFVRGYWVEQVTHFATTRKDA